MNYDTILSTTNNGITTITVNRPNKLNALNKATIGELHSAFKAAGKDKDTKVIIITGSGEKAFVAGADISEFADFDIKNAEKLAAEGQKMLFDYIENLSTPVIAAVNGFALGGGLELAMACHFRVASTNAQRLPQLVGKGRAMEMVMTAGMIDADKALEYGLVNHVTSQEELIALAEKIAGKIMRNSSVAIKGAIKAINANYKDGIDGYNTEIKQFGKCFGTEDFKEGTTAFLEKRKAEFPGK
jgi:enoyl-CoA hydratase